MVAQACVILALGKEETGSGAQSHPRLYSEFKGSLGYMKLCHQPHLLRKGRTLLFAL